MLTEADTAAASEPVEIPKAQEEDNLALSLEHDDFFGLKDTVKLRELFQVGLIVYEGGSALYITQ